MSWRHRVEAALTRFAIAGFHALPPKAASATGGWIGRHLLAPLPVSRRAARNLALAMPDIDAGARRRIIREMWENIGRTAGELPHLGRVKLPGDKIFRVDVIGAEQIYEFVEAGQNLLYASAHQGNWELLPLLARNLGTPIHVVYRAANNPLFDAVIGDLRESTAIGTVAKGPAGARHLMALLRRGENVGLLIDQKLNDGIAVPFFGRPAMTAPAVAQLARRFELPIIPAQCERLGGTHFRITLHPALWARRSDDRDGDVAEVMAELNRMIESWIRQRPGQWLWLHRRWPNSDPPPPA